MIENIILNVLKSDAKLAELLDGRIYPDVAQVNTLPCVIMSASSPLSPNAQPWMYTQNLTFEIYADDLKSAQAVRARLYEMLQRYDDFFYSDAQKSGVIIRSAHAVPASVSNYFPLETRQAKELAASFDFTYTKCAGTAR